MVQYIHAYFQQASALLVFNVAWILIKLKRQTQQIEYIWLPIQGSSEMKLQQIYVNDFFAL